MKRIFGAILFVIYSIIAITVTVLLLSYNEYNISEIGGYTVYIVNNDGLEPEYKQGSILLIKSTNDKHVQVGDSLFFYKVANSSEFEFVNRTLVSKVQQGRRIVYSVSEDEAYDSSRFVGKADDTIVIEGPWGTILSILESKWGYLFCIVIVSLLLFLQEVFDLIIEIKYGGGKSAKKTSTTKKTNTSTKTSTPKTRTSAPKTSAAKASAPKATTPKTVEAKDTQVGVKEEG